MTATIITDAQKASFKEDGYLILRNVLSEEAQLELIRMTQEVKDWPDTPGSISLSSLSFFAAISDFRLWYLIKESGCHI